MEQESKNFSTEFIKMESISNDDPGCNRVSDLLNEEKSDDDFILHWSKVADGFQKFRKFEYLCDIVLISKSGTEFKAHRLLLAAVSSAFKIAFENGLPSVELPEMDDDTIEFFLRFVYSGRLSLPKEFEQYDKLSALLFSLQNLGIEVNSIENSAFEIDRDSENSNIDKCSNAKEAVQSDNSYKMLPLPVAAICDDIVEDIQLESSKTQTNLRKSKKKVKMYKTRKKKNSVDDDEKMFDPDQIIKDEDEAVFLNSSNISTGDRVKDELLDAKDEKPFKNSKDDKVRGKRKKTKLKPKSMVCQYCGMTLGRHSIRSHIQSQHEKKINFKCKECEMIFITESARYKHTVRMHTRGPDGQQIEFICELCGKIYKNKLALYHHSYAHSHKREVKQQPDNSDKDPKNKYMCRFCRKEFKLRSSLYAHMIKHEEYGKELPYVCECGMRFPFKSIFLEHQRIHGNDRPFSCSECNKRFKSKNIMQSHRRLTHGTERRYVCSLCGNSFKQSHHLAQHMVHHSDARPFACTLCEKTYKVKHDLKLHCRRVHQMELVANVEAKKIHTEIKHETNKSGDEPES